MEALSEAATLVVSARNDFMAESLKYRDAAARMRSVFELTAAVGNGLSSTANEISRTLEILTATV